MILALIAQEFSQGEVWGLLAWGLFGSIGLGVVGWYFGNFIRDRLLRRYPYLDPEYKRKSPRRIP